MNSEQLLAIFQPHRILLYAKGSPDKRSRRVSVKAFRWPDPVKDGPIHTDKIDLDDKRERNRFVAAVAEIEPAVDTAELQTRLMKLKVCIPTKPKRTLQSLPKLKLARGRPQIQTNDRQLHEIRQEALDALRDANDPPRLFSRGGGVARIVTTRDELGNTTPRVQQLDAAGLRGELSNVADWVRLQGSEGEEFVNVAPPEIVATDILSLPTHELPLLTGIITCPTYTSAGELIIEDGFHATSGLWHHRTLGELPLIPENPTPYEITIARELLEDIIADFPFVDQASRANTFAMTLMKYARPLIDGPTPMYAVDAPAPGTGKDLLVKATLSPVLGKPPGIRTGAKDSDEWRKRITSALLASSPVVVFGNLTRRVDSEHLAAVLTDLLWEDRELQFSRDLRLPNLSLWACTGNNLRFSGEIARRVVWIRLDAKVEAPEKRTKFRHRNLLAYIREHRTELVVAALTLIRAWMAAGRPSGSQVMGSYESFTEIMGGILDVAGIAGFLENAEELRRHTDTDSREWQAFVRTWWERWQNSWVGVKDLAGLLWLGEKDRSALLTTVVDSDNSRGAATQLGRRLSSKRDCVIAGFRLVIDDSPDNSGRLQYRLLPQTSGPTDGSLPEVCDEVCNRNSSTDMDLEHDADLCILHSDPEGTSHRYICDGNPSEAGNKYAKVCTSPQTNTEQQVTTADFAADLKQTSDPTLQSLRTPDHAHSKDDVAGIPANWNRSSWIDHLRQVADTCESVRPDMAAIHRAEADRLEAESANPLLV